jgi:hypothetical protein
MSRGHTGCEALSRLRDEARVGRFELELSDRDVRVQISFSALMWILRSVRILRFVRIPRFVRILSGPKENLRSLEPALDRLGLVWAAWEAGEAWEAYDGQDDWND